MSGSIGPVLSAVGEVAQLLGGSAPVTLGGVTFSGFELPERMPFGGQQQLAVHRMPGGARVLDAMGPDDRDISWSGFFSGPGAAARARQLDAMRIAGAAIDLAWSDFQRRVVISAFTPDYAYNGAWIPYSITLVVVPQAAGQGATSLLGSLGRDISDALGLPSLAPALGQAQAALTTVQAALPAMGTLTRGSPAFSKLAGGLAAAQGLVDAGTAAADGRMRGVISGIVQSSSVAGGSRGMLAASQLSAAAAAAGALAGLAAAAGSVGRARANLGTVGS